MNLSLAIVFLFSGAALTTLGILLYKKVSQDEQEAKKD